MELKCSYTCSMFMKINKLKAKILIILFIYISTNVSAIILNEKPKNRKGWLDAYSYGLAFDFSPRWKK